MTSVLNEEEEAAGFLPESYLAEKCLKIEWTLSEP